MNSKEFRVLLIIQVITLILVAILFFDTLTVKDSGVAQMQAVAVNSNATDNNKKGVNVQGANDPFAGDKEAPNYMIVFSRYNCDYCKYFYKHVFDSLDKAYISTGKLKLIYKDLVGPEDAFDMMVAKMAEVANQANKFGEFHKSLVDENPSDSTSVVRLALKTGITNEEIERNINSEATFNNIHNDYLEATSLNITATPSFVINGKTYIGYMNFKDISEKLK